MMAGRPHVRVTRDREEIIHLAGRNGLSPALRDGAPALLAKGEQEGRCGWQPFFQAMEARRLALAIAGEGESLRFVPRGETAAPGPAPAAGGRLAEVRRFVRALRGRPPHPGS